MGHQLKAVAALAGNPDLILDTHVAAHNGLQLQFWDI